MRSPFLLVGALAGGLTVSQYPEYAQQYHQRLGGAVQELSVVVENFDQDAASQGLTRSEALARYDASTDQFLIERGGSMSQTIARYNNLKAHQIALQNAGPVEEITAFAQHLDQKLLSDALNEYKPAVPFTPKGLTFAGIGLFIGWLMFRLVWGLFAFPFRRRVRVSN
ncbi:DUF2937 family protein [Maritalea sp.]|uniref:DUF2937 family protein n=1 Tax=Maritalea sp. TaxID=2003361 RepID=UPI003EF47910